MQLQTPQSWRGNKVIPIIIEPLLGRSTLSTRQRADSAWSVGHDVPVTYLIEPFQRDRIVFPLKCQGHFGQNASKGILTVSVTNRAVSHFSRITEAVRASTPPPPPSTHALSLSLPKSFLSLCQNPNSWRIFYNSLSSPSSSSQPPQPLTKLQLHLQFHHRFRHHHLPFHGTKTTPSLLHLSSVPSWSTLASMILPWPFILLPTPPSPPGADLPPSSLQPMLPSAHVCPAQYLAFSKNTLLQALSLSTICAR